MEKLNFTPEQIKYLKKKWNWSFTEKSYSAFLDSLLKPKTKFIDVRIEYEGDLNLSSFLKYDPKLPSENNDTFKNVKITELPEVFTRQDMIEFANYHHHVDETVETNINDWLSERKSK